MSFVCFLLLPFKIKYLSRFWLRTLNNDKKIIAYGLWDGDLTELEKKARN